MLLLLLLLFNGMTCQQYARTGSCSLVTVLTFLNFQSDKGGLQLVKLRTCGQAPSFENIFALRGSGCSPQWQGVRDSCYLQTHVVISLKEKGTVSEWGVVISEPTATMVVLTDFSQSDAVSDCWIVNKLWSWLPLTPMIPGLHLLSVHSAP